MHSLRNAFVAKPVNSRPQSLFQQPWKRLSLGIRNTVEPTAEAITVFLQDVSLRAQQHTGNVDTSKLAHLRATVHRLQDVTLRDPQARDLVARRLSLLKSSMTTSQKLQDYDSVYLAPYVDDLDNYLQGVLNDVNRVEIPSFDDDEDKAVTGSQTLRAVASASLPDSSSSNVDAATQDDGDHFRTLRPAQASMLRARDSRYDPQAVQLQVHSNALWGKGGSSAMKPAAYHFHKPLSMAQMADGDYVPNAYASGGPSHSNIATADLNQYRAPVGSSMLRALPALNAYRVRLQNLAAPGVGQVTYTDETSATPWGSVVNAPHNDFIDTTVSRGFRAVASRGAYQLMGKYGLPLESVVGLGTDVPGRDGYEYRPV